MKLTEFKALLESACENVFYFESKETPPPRIVYVETGRKYERYDGLVGHKWWVVDVHFFTDKDFDPIVERLEDLFSDNGVPFHMADIQHGRDSEGRGGLNYYRFVCEV